MLMAPTCESTAALTFAPLTPERWPDIERLFGRNGACGGCWCMWWKRTRDEFARGKGAANKRAFRRIVASGAEPGLIAYRAGAPIGWCAVEPREHYAVLARSPALAPVDDQPVWSVTCFFVKAGHRRSGVGLALLNEAMRFVATRGGRLIEGYPKDLRGKFPGANSVWMGLATTFTAAGFEEVARRAPTRPIMRIAVRTARTISRPAGR
jgi:GNAT superfamily N-acetyltransferase